MSAKAVLLTTDDRVARQAKREAEGAVKAATDQLENVRRTSKRHELQRQKQQAAVTAAESRVVAAELTVELKRSLRTLKQVSEKEIAIAEEMAAECRAAVTGEQASLAELDLVDPQHAIVQAEADLERAEAKLAQAQATLESQPICARPTARCCGFWPAPARPFRPPRRPCSSRPRARASCGRNSSRRRSTRCPSARRRRSRTTRTAAARGRARSRTSPIGSPNAARSSTRRRPSATCRPSSASWRSRGTGRRRASASGCGSTSRPVPGA